MKKLISRVFVCFFLIQLSGALYAQNCVQIGEDVYTRIELEKYAKEKNIDPIAVIENLKMDEVIKIFAKKVGIQGPALKDSVYKHVTGFNYKTDKLQKKLLDIPPKARKAASLRQLIFNRWIVQMADESVPVIFIDPESVSEILKTSHSYQMRKNAGAEPKIGNWDYSWKELQIDTGLVVATKHKKPFLTGREYNLYIKNNFGGIRHFAKRRVDIDTLRIRIAENIIAGKIVLLDTPKVDVKIASTLVHEFVRRRMFSESFTMKNIDAGTVSAYMEKLYQRYQTLNEDAIAKLKTKLKEETNNPMDDYLGVLLQMKGKTAVLKKKIYDTIRNETVYKWMKTNGFKGTFDEGKAMLVAEKYRKHIEDKIEQNDIQLTLN